MSNIEKKIQRLLDEWSIIDRGEQFSLAFIDYLARNVLKAVSKAINDKIGRLRSDNLTYRMINHWEEKGLLSTKRPGGKGWRKYSIMDLVWTYIILELRKFGYPLELIHNVKKSLENLNRDVENSEFPLLEFFVVLAITHRSPAYLIVFHDGHAEPVFQLDFHLKISKIDYLNYLVINLNSMVQKALPGKELTPNFGEYINLSASELDLLYMIQMEGYESITVITGGGKIERLEANKSVKESSRIIDLIRGGDYQDIEIKQRDGQIVRIRQKIIKKYE